MDPNMIDILIALVFGMYAGIVLDTYILDAYYGGAYDSVKGYLTQPWETVKRAAALVSRAAKSLYWKVRFTVEDAAESLWAKITN